jgi:dTDP-4-dehydrorhamnose reductase
LRRSKRHSRAGRTAKDNRTGAAPVYPQLNKYEEHMRILVTGASGLLGLNLALEASSAGHQVFGVTNQHPLRTQRFTVLQADLLESGALERLLEQTQPDWVIHCAALANVDACEEAPTLAQHINAAIPAKLAQLVARGGARLVHISTDAVFDGQRGDYAESDEPNPLSVYAQSKLAGEDGVAAANPDAIIARVNLFGWSMSGRRSLGEFFVHNLQAGRQVNGFTDVIFCPLLVNDIAGLLLDMLALELHGLYHVVSRECLSKYEFGVRLATQFGLDSALIRPISVAAGGLKAARSPRLSLNTHKLSTDLGYPPPEISPAIMRFYTLYQQGYPQQLQQMSAKDTDTTGA